jgi:hypothetical protein
VIRYGLEARIGKVWGVPLPDYTICSIGSLTGAPSAASRRTMPAPIPREPPVTSVRRLASGLLTTSFSRRPNAHYQANDACMKSGVSPERHDAPRGRR